MTGLERFDFTQEKLVGSQSLFPSFFPVVFQDLSLLLVDANHDDNDSASTSFQSFFSIIWWCRQALEKQSLHLLKQFKCTVEPFHDKLSLKMLKKKMTWRFTWNINSSRQEIYHVNNKEWKDKEEAGKWGVA